MVPVRQLPRDRCALREVQGGADAIPSAAITTLLRPDQQHENGLSQSDMAINLACSPTMHERTMCRTSALAIWCERVHTTLQNASTRGHTCTPRASAHQQDATPTNSCTHSHGGNSSRDARITRCMIYMHACHGLSCAIRELCVEHLLALPALVPPNTMQRPNARTSLAFAYVEIAVVLLESKS